MNIVEALNIIVILGFPLADAKHLIAKRYGQIPYSVNFSDRDPDNLSGIFEVGHGHDSNPLKGLKPTGIFKLEKDLKQGLGGNPVVGLKPTGIFKLGKDLKQSGGNPLEGLKPTGIFKLEKDLKQRPIPVNTEARPWPRPPPCYIDWATRCAEGGNPDAYGDDCGRNWAREQREETQRHLDGWKYIQASRFKDSPIFNTV